MDAEAADLETLALGRRGAQQARIPPERHRLGFARRSARR
jgi:hypothetical protein